MTILEIIGSAILLAGVGLSFLAAWGLLDFPSALARMHAATKSASLGLALIAVGAGVAAESAGLVGIGLLVAIFMFLTAPISGHMLGRATYAAGQVSGLVHDDLATAAPQTLTFRPDERGRPSPTRMIPLVIIWVLLWRDASLGVWVGGVAIAALIELIRRRRSERVKIRPGAALVFLSRYLWMVAMSNVRVAWEVITPRNDQIREAIVAVPISCASVPVALLVANAITYTPGTLTVELTEDPLVLYVHVLHFESVAAVRKDVAALEDLVCAALVTPQPA
ncbi:MAG: Na+/H+ antiporter subunit E [Acidimicrobiia bacterium]|nr:Na+/H+ antiporter subunit E [Acidimicrobiia bacterium]